MSESHRSRRPRAPIQALVAIAKDRVWQLCALLALAVSLPIGTGALRDTYIDPWLDMTLLAATVTALGYGLRRLDHPERRFWQLWTAAMACWLMARFAHVMAPDAWRGPTYSLINDCTYLVYYLLLFLALETTPHQVGVLEFDQRLRRLRLAGTTLLVFCLLIYFGLVPRHLKPEVYESWLPRFDLYIVLDLLLALGYGLIARSCGNRRWSVLYGLMAIAAVFWTLGDLTITLASAPESTVSIGSAFDFIWYVPLVLLIAAARGRQRIGDDLESTGEYAFIAQFGRPLALAAVALPTIHLVLYTSRLADRDLQPTRELLVLVGVLVLGMLAYVEQQWMQRQLAESNAARQAAARRAIERSAFLDSLIDQSPLAIVSLDRHYRITLCNPAFEQLFGYGQEELLDKSPIDYIMPDERYDEAYRVGAEVLEGAPARIVTQRKHRDGRIIDVELLAVPLLIDKALVGILAFYRDLTEQVRAERARRRVEERLRRLTEAAFEGIVILDGRTIVDANVQLADMFGHPIGSLDGTSINALVTPAERERLDEQLARAHRRPVEIEGLRRDHTTFRVEVRARQSEGAADEHGSVDGEGTVLAIHDLSEREALEAQLRHSQKMEAIGRLAGGIAHDFNNLLTVILGRTELLSMQLEGKESESLGEISHAAQLATSLTRQLLVFAKHQQPHLERFDLTALVAATAESMLRRLIADDVELEVALASETATVCADRNLIDQLVVNLGLNAQDAMPKGGALRLETARVDLPEGRSAYGLEMESGSAIRLTITDTGVGIAPEAMPNVFDPFFSTKDRGSGLGLATVYGIVRQCGGVIEVESVVGWGSSFHVYLPLDTRAPESTPAASEEDETPMIVEGPSESRASILLVEDVPEVRALLVNFLERNGFAVWSAGLPSEALAMLDGEGEDGCDGIETIDLLITDVIMPGMRGPQLVEAVRARRGDMKVLYMSGYASPEVGIEIAEGEDAFLEKPFALSKLLDVVHALLTTRAA